MVFVSLAMKKKAASSGNRQGEKRQRLQAVALSTSSVWFVNLIVNMPGAEEKGTWTDGSVNTSVVQSLLKNFDPLHRFLQRLDCLHVEHRIVNALGDGAKVVAVFVTVRGFAD